MPSSRSTPRSRPTAGSSPTGSDHRRLVRLRDRPVVQRPAIGGRLPERGRRHPARLDDVLRGAELAGGRQRAAVRLDQRRRPAGLLRRRRDGPQRARGQVPRPQHLPTTSAGARPARRALARRHAAGGAARRRHDGRGLRGPQPLRRDPALRRQRATTPTPRCGIVDPDGAELGPPSWSPGGDALAWATPDGIYTSPVSSGSSTGSWYPAAAGRIGTCDPAGRAARAAGPAAADADAAAAAARPA